jgi:thiol-disulfide isomerase/thioredoxin
MNLVRLSALLLSAALCTAACQSKTPETNTTGIPGPTDPTLLIPGMWHGELAAQGQQIPFLFEAKNEGGKLVVYLINKGLNGEERLRCPEVTQAGDSMTVRLHVFDAALVLRQNPANTDLMGTWVKYDAKTPYRVPLTVAQILTSDGASNPYQTAKKDKPAGRFDGNWRATFTDEEGKSYPTVGLFKESAEGLAGTFLTSTGDYRYLSGVADAEQDGYFKVTTFDGNHAFLFTALKQPDGTLKGDFYSGKSGHETWTAVKDDNAKLPDANALTGMKPGQKRLDFKFPNIYAGGSISPTDPKYKGKVVVVQILGSWCPNCMDETNFLAPWYEKNKGRGVEIIGLGYERSPDQKKASERLVKMRERLNVGYDMAIAGVSNKDSASKSLPQLAQVLAFPTTIFLDKKGEVRKIHTGFSGPGTGKYYQQEITEFNQTIDKLLQE